MCRQRGLHLYNQGNVGKCRRQGESGVYCQVVSSVFLSNVIFQCYARHCFRQKPEFLSTKLKKSKSKGASGKKLPTKIKFETSHLK